VAAFLVEALKGNMFFGALGDNELASIAEAMEPMNISSGSTLWRAGEEGDTFFVVESGRLELLLPGGQREEFGEGTQFKVFGELAVLFNTPRSATVRATTNARLWRVDRATYRALAAVGMEENTRSIKAALKRGGILESLEGEQLDRVAEAATRVRFGPGEQIFRKGEPGDVFYVIEKGSVLCKDQPGEQRDNMLCEGDYFGERALLKREVRVSNAFAGNTGSTLIAIHRVDFEALLGHLRDLLEHNAGMRLLLCVPVLADCSEEDKAALFRRLRLISFRAGQVLASEGTAMTQLFIIKEGEVEVGCSKPGGSAMNPALLKKLSRSRRTVPSPTATSASGLHTIGALGAGHWFGESEVGDISPSPFTYTAITPVQCFVLDSEAYKLYLAPVMEKWGDDNSRAATPGSESSSSLTVAQNPPGSRASMRPDGIVKSAVVSGKIHRERLGIPLRDLELRCVVASCRLVFALRTFLFYLPNPRFPFTQPFCCLLKDYIRYGDIRTGEDSVS